MSSDERFSEADRKRLDSLSQSKQRDQDQKDGILKKIIDTQATYGAVYKKNAPVLKIPAEITCLIFSFALALSREKDNSVEEDDEESGGPAKSDEFLMEVIVSHVCHQWRTIALALSSLWSRFRFDGPRSQHIPLDRFFAYLERSGAQLLELWLNLSGTERTPRLHLDLLQRAILHVERWKCVTIIVDEEIPLSSLVHLSPMIHAPNLEHLVLCLDIEFPESPSSFHLDLTPTIFTSGAPKLKSVWMGVSSLPVLLPPLANVTTLRIEDLRTTPDIRYSWQTYLNILAIPTLANLSLFGLIFEKPMPHQVMRDIPMDNLKHLRSSNYDYLFYALPYFRAPQLETITIQYSDLGSDIPFSTDAKPYFFPSLKELALNEVVLLKPEFPLAYLFSSVKELVLSYSEPEACISHRLTELADPVKRMWPHLQVITCNFQCDYYDLSCLDFLMNVAQWRTSKPITYRILVEYVIAWQYACPDRLELLEECCIVEEMESDLLLTRKWPPNEVPTGYMVLHPHPDLFAIDVYMTQ